MLILFIHFWDHTEHVSSDNGVDFYFRGMWFESLLEHLSMSRLFIPLASVRYRP
jgi:hypothetical protein